jgi:hypothetical protein
MHYELKSKDGLLKPKAVLTLENLGDMPLYNMERGLRHPLGIYNFTFNEVVTKFLTLIDLLEKAKEKLPHINREEEKWDEKILDATDHVLDAIMQHLDSFKSIICCFYSDCNAKEAQKVNRSLQREIREYRDHVAKIVNLIKHKQRRLSTILFHGPGIFDLGYYVEGVLPDGAVGPDPEVHAGSNVAISFNRDLPFHLCNIYYCSAALATHVHKICGATPSRTSEEPKTEDQLAELITRVAAMPMQFFPDEAEKPIPLVRLIPLRNANHFNATLEMPSKRLKARTIPEGCRVQVSFKGDGVSRSFKMPYFGEDAPNK